MKKIVLFFFMLSGYLANAQQYTAEQIKTSLTNKNWSIVSYEMFGVAEEPKPDQVNDKILLNTDMTFVIIEKGKEYKGKWSIMNPSVYITCKATNTNWSKTYKIISIGETESIIQYKDPDLIKTDYRLVVK